MILDLFAYSRYGVQIIGKPTRHHADAIYVEWWARSFSQTCFALRTQHSTCLK